MSLPGRPAAELLNDLTSRRVSAVELMRATLDRIDKVNGRVNAIVAMRDADDLLAEAQAVDNGELTGPLHGLPVAVKDLANVKGIVSSQGSPLYRDFVPDRDELIVERMRRAGAIPIGKTNSPEFGLGSHTFNPVYGATLNPYDAGRTCGGSSGGAAVALATGMVALADGSDMMGSLRNPAAWNNVYGFRPSWGRVPPEPSGDTFLHQLSTLGPMARSPADMALLLDVIQGADPRQPHAFDCDAISPLQPSDLRGVKIGWLSDWGGAFPMEDGILDLSLNAIRVLENLGCDVEEVAPPFSADAMWESWTTLRSWQVASGLAEHADKRDRLKHTARWEMDRGLSFTAMDVHRASVIRSEWFHQASALFQSYDALVLPSAQVWPFDVSIEYPTRIAGVEMDTYHRWMQVVLPVSLLGLPCVAAPVGFGDNGLPMGVQIFGPRGSDARLLSLAETYHQATRWPQERPAQ